MRQTPGLDPISAPQRRLRHSVLPVVTPFVAKTRGCLPRPVRERKPPHATGEHEEASKRPDRRGPVMGRGVLHGGGGVIGTGCHAFVLPGKET